MDKSFKRIWERSLEERRNAQVGNVRDLLIGSYAPCEPQVMQGVFNFLQAEKKYPLKNVHNIMDRLAGMMVTTNVVTHDEVLEFIKSIPDGFAIACGPCACRLHTASIGPDARDLASGKLNLCRQSPLNVDIQIAKCGEKFGALPTYKMISKDELLALEEECFNHGLVANIYLIMGGEAGICHCSSATCVPFMANEALGGASSVINKGALIPVTDKTMCLGNGNCAKVCHFKARKQISLNGRTVSTVDYSRCYGCGLCAAVCPEKAIKMEPRKSIKNG